MKWHNPNLGLNPADPAYDDRFDAEEDYERFIDACIERAEKDR